MQAASTNGSQVAQRVKNMPAIQEVQVQSLGGEEAPLQYSSLKNPHGQSSLAGHSPWSRKELDMTEQLTLSLPTSSSYLPKLIYSPWEVRLSLPLESTPHSCLPVTGLAVATAVLPGGRNSGFTYSRHSCAAAGRGASRNNAALTWLMLSHCPQS